jgi:secretion/DNA translocation related TadE-like protein
VNEDGSVGLVVAAVAALVMLLTVALAAVAGVHSARQRATTAADAAALAAAPVTFLPFGAAGTPTDEAGRFARLNGASLISCRCAIDRSFEARTVEVRVRTRVDAPLLGAISVEAIGRAEFAPAALLGG